MAKNKQNRRTFLNKLGLGCASIGTTTLLSGITNLGLVNAAAAANSSNSFFSPATNNYKALVCVLLSGGNDSYNMLVPKGTSEYAEYAAVRTNLAVPQNDLLPINPLNPDGKQYGLHPSLPKLQSLFESENAAFVANVGALVEPTTLNDYYIDKNLPLGLFSHADQRNHWQTSIPQDRNALGWGGRLADILSVNNLNQDISMNISLDGLNQFQKGEFVQPYSIVSTGGGSVSLNNASNTNFYESLKRETLDSLLEQNYLNILDNAYRNTIIGSKNNSFEFSSAINNVSPFTTTFQDDKFSQRMHMIAKTIAARNEFQVSNQTFFVQLGGFDTHDNIIAEHASLLENLDNALKSFYDAMDELTIGSDVTTFTISDFSRKLVSNGDGSDHGWGGHAIVIGGDVNGKKIYGNYPDLYLGNNLDTGEGRIIPTTSCDEYFSELALWFGASSSDLNQIFPNINNFWTPSTNNYPIGFMS